MFYIILIFSAVVAWRAASSWPTLLLVLLIGVWHAGYTLYFAPPAEHLRQAPATYAYVLGLMALWFALTLNHAIFHFLLFALYALLFASIQMKAAVPLSILLSGMVVYTQAATSGQAIFEANNPWLIYFVLSTTGGLILAFFINSIIRQSNERLALIEQLEAAQADLAAAKRREGMLQERERLAREIHDTLAQAFIGIITHLEAGDDTHHHEQAQAMARQGLTQARRVVQDLRPDLLEQAHLHEAIKRAAQSWAKQSGITANTAVTGNPIPLHPQAETTLLRAVQEALANVQKHAHATAVQITLSYMGNVLMLDVYDNGRGLPTTPEPASDHSGGYGLIAMRQRAAQLGGEVTIESEPDEGTTLTLQLPLHLFDNQQETPSS